MPRYHKEPDTLEKIVADAQRKAELAKPAEPNEPTEQ